MPTLAERIRVEFAADLGSRSGRLVMLGLCTQLTSHPDYAGPLYEPARREAGRLLDVLSR